MAKKKSNKAKDPQKSAQKAGRSEDRKTKKNLLKETGEEDIEKILADLEEEQQQLVAVTETVLTEPPTPRCNFHIVLHPHSPEIIMFGGERFNGEKTFFFQDLMRFHLERQEWRLITSPNTPPPRSAHQMVALPTSATSGKGAVLLFGGEFASLSQSQFYHYRDLWRLDLATNSWSKIDEPKGPTARSGHRMVVTKHKLVVFGGFHDNLKSCEYYNDTFIFDLEQHHWTKLSVPPNQPIPPPRSGHQMVAYNNVIFVYGGFCKQKVEPVAPSAKKAKGGKEESVLNEKGVEHIDLWSLDTVTWRWSQCKIPGFQPSPRSGFSMVAQPVKKRCFFFGGVHDSEFDEESGGSLFYDELFEFSLDTNRWRQLRLRKPKEKSKAKAKAKRSANRAQVDADVAMRDTDNDNEPQQQTDDHSASTHKECEAEEDDDMVDDVKDDVGDEAAQDDVAQGDVEEEEKLSVPQARDRSQQWPMRRMNCQMVINGNKLILFGGVLEVNDRELTLSDMWEIDVVKLDSWRCIIPLDMSNQDWQEEPNSDESDSQSGDSESAGSDSDRMNESETSEPEVTPSSSATRDTRQAMRQHLAENIHHTPRLFESLKDFFSRTGAHWATQAFEVTQRTGKALRKDGFELAQERYTEMRPVLAQLETEEIEAQQQAEQSRQEAKANTKSKGRR